MNHTIRRRLFVSAVHRRRRQATVLVAIVVGSLASVAIMFAGIGALISNHWPW